MVPPCLLFLICKAILELQEITISVTYDKLCYWIDMGMRTTWREFCQVYKSSLHTVTRAKIKVIKRSHAWYTNIKAFGLVEVLKDMPNCNCCNK